MAISRLLNATLVIPEIQQSTRSKGIRYSMLAFLENVQPLVQYASKPYLSSLILYFFTVINSRVFPISTMRSSSLHHSKMI